MDTSHAAEVCAIRERDAAVRIQAVERGRRARILAKRQQSAAVTIQRHERGRRARLASAQKAVCSKEDRAYEETRRKRNDRLQRRQQELTFLKDVDANHLREWENKRESGAATRLQASWRRKQAQKSTQSFSSRRSLAARTIQHHYRKHKGTRPTGEHFPAHDESVQNPLAANEAAMKMLFLDRGRKAELLAKIKHRTGELKMLWTEKPSKDEMTQVSRDCREKLTRHQQLRSVVARRALSQQRVIDSAKLAATREEYWRSKRLANLQNNAKVSDFIMPSKQHVDRVKQLHTDALKAARLESRWWRAELDIDALRS